MFHIYKLASLFIMLFHVLIKIILQLTQLVNKQAGNTKLTFHPTTFSHFIPTKVIINTNIWAQVCKQVLLSMTKSAKSTFN